MCTNLMSKIFALASAPAVAAAGPSAAIVDLMKLVGIESSFAARKELAAELYYTGDPNDSASMNIWPHKKVLTKLAENGEKVPPELLS